MLPVCFEPDIVLPVQFRCRTAVRAEERLMLAILGDALAGFQKYAFARDTRGRRLFREADNWIHCRDREWPFSFENICDILKIDAAYVRGQRERWSGRQHASTSGPAAPGSSGPKCNSPAAYRLC